MGNQLFVVSNESSTVCVFDLTSFTQLQSIELGGLLKDPQDIATCEVTQSIYIADCGNKCVWRIDWSSSLFLSTVTDDSLGLSAVKFIEGYSPWRLSMSGRRQQLLVTSCDGNSLYVYDVDGKQLRRVKLSTEVGDDGVKWNDIRHAVQATAGDNYFVCRLGNDQPQKLLCTYSHAEVW
jgi:DNA-binding beta-propeller fold protein YncE